MWNCPICHRPQTFKHLVLGPGLVRKEWRCDYCNALLASTLIAKAMIGVLAGASVAVLLTWMASDILDSPPYVYVFVVCFSAALSLCCGRIVAVEVGHKVCAHCHYDLQGNITGACPECGMKFDDVGSPNGQSQARGSASPRMVTDRIRQQRGGRNSHSR